MPRQQASQRGADQSYRMRALRSRHKWQQNITRRVLPQRGRSGARPETGRTRVVRPANGLPQRSRRPPARFLEIYSPEGGRQRRRPVRPARWREGHAEAACEAMRMAKAVAAAARPSAVYVASPRDTGAAAATENLACPVVEDTAQARGRGMLSI